MQKCNPTTICIQLRLGGKKGKANGFQVEGTLECANNGVAH